jgi:hypothetical protein
MMVHFWIRVVCAAICAVCAGFNLRKYRRYGFTPQLIVGVFCMAMTAVSLMGAVIALEAA